MDIKPFRIAFTGHRDRKANWWTIKDILDYYTDVYDVEGFIVVHGGAEGFDTQVSRVAKKFFLQEEVIRPDYNRFGKVAPLKRNEIIIKSANVVFALYDGRTKGGTFHAINYANKLGKQVYFLNVKE